LRVFFPSSDRWLFFLNSDRLFVQSSDGWLFFLSTNHLFFGENSRLDRGRTANIDRSGCRRLQIPIRFIVIGLWIEIAAVGEEGDRRCSERGIIGPLGIQQLAQPIQFISTADRAKSKKLARFRMLGQLDHRNTHQRHIRHQLRVRPARRSECERQNDDGEEHATCWEDPNEPQHPVLDN
jgi:hypothetical protein